MRRILFPILMGIVGAAVLIGLGVWQVQRLEWKEAILAEIDARIADAPVALPASPDPAADRFLPVTAEGAFGAEELHVLVSLKGVGPGYRVISAFTTAEGRRVMVDRGFISADEKEAERPSGAARIVGNLHWPEEVDSFTPAPDPAANIWFARDVPAMAAKLGTEPVLIILRQTSAPVPGMTPLPVDSGGIPNDHLEYAITWFGLAVVWIAMTVFLIWRLRRPKE